MAIRQYSKWQPSAIFIFKIKNFCYSFVVYSATVIYATKFEANWTICDDDMARKKHNIKFGTGTEIRNIINLANFLLIGQRFRF